MGTKPNRKRLRQLCEAFVTQALRLPEWRKYEATKGLPEFQALYAFAENEGLVAKIGVSKFDADGKPLPPDAHDLWTFYLLPLLKRSSEGTFGDLYPLLEESLYVDHATWQVAAPLAEFVARGGPVDLANGVTIRQFTASEKQHFDDFQNWIGFEEAIVLGLLGANFAMSCRKQSPKAGPQQWGLGDQDFDTAVSALRLLKRGAVWYNVKARCIEHPPFGTQSAVGVRGTDWSSKPRLYGPEYELLEVDVEPLKELVTRLPDAGRHRRLQVALGRFNVAYERSRAEDKLVDLWIALEALFLSDEPPQELRYRASLRAAWFVGERAEEREEIFRQIRDSYDARSAIVHGREPKDVPSIAEFTEDVLRRALRKAIVTPQSLDTKQLDGLIVRGS